VPADELKQYYAGLSDEGLREIERDDLTDIARATYDAELAARGLTIERAAPVADAEPEPSLEDMGWVPLATFNHEEIELVRALLEAEEIPSDMDLRSSSNYPPQPEGSILYVPEQFLARAREVLASQISEEELIAAAEAGEPPEDA
jgi:hypothetical protein